MAYQRDNLSSIKEKCEFIEKTSQGEIVKFCRRHDQSLRADTGWGSEPLPSSPPIERITVVVYPPAVSYIKTDVFQMPSETPNLFFY